MTTGDIAITLSHDEALVLFEWLARIGEGEHPELFEHPAERTVLWTIETRLESLLLEPFDANYPSILDAARDRVAAAY